MNKILYIIQCRINCLYNIYVYLYVYILIYINVININYVYFDNFNINLF